MDTITDDVVLGTHARPCRTMRNIASLLKLELNVGLLLLRTASFLGNQLTDVDVLICVHLDVLAGGEEVTHFHPRVPTLHF